GVETCVYDGRGQLLSGSMMDYTMPRADDLPPISVATHTTLCTHNPLGVKGCGEVGAIGSPPAVINAVLDALKPLGVQDITMPATRSEEHTSELQSLTNLVCRLLLEKKKAEQSLDQLEQQSERPARSVGYRRAGYHSHTPSH